MRLRVCHVGAAAVALLTAVVMLAVGGGAGSLRAAAQQPASSGAATAASAAAISARTASAAFFETKVVLPETSIDGPALNSIFVQVATVRSVIGWTGTDAAHHLNVETITNAQHLSNKLTLRDTSPFRPDVTQTEESDGGQVIVAWTGSDANHSLNVLFDVYGSKPLKLTLRNENSFTAPAVLLMGSTLLLAWTGTNAAHSLNILPITFTGTSLVPGRKTILSAFSSDAGPHLAHRGTNIVVLNWTSRTDHLTVATSPDGVQFPDVATSAQTSAFAPDTLSGGTRPEAEDWMGWTGTDAAHHLNVQFTASFPSFPNPATKTVLGDTAFGGPAMALPVLGKVMPTQGEIAWTGTDSVHHLNLASWSLVG